MTLKNRTPRNGDSHKDVEKAVPVELAPKPRVEESSRLGKVFRVVFVSPMIIMLIWLVTRYVSHKLVDGNLFLASFSLC